MATICLIVALILALIAALLGFGTFTTSGDPHVLGWLSLSFFFYILSILVGSGAIPRLVQRDNR